MKVLAFGCWDEGDGYPRTSGLFEALALAGVELTPVRIEGEGMGRDKQRLLRRPWLWPGFWLRQRATRRRAQAALRAALAEQQPDLVLVPYPGHLAVRWARQVYSGPLVLDMFLSAYDTAVLDRRIFRPGTPMAAWVRRMDRRAAEAADLVLMDTVQNAAFLKELLPGLSTSVESLPLSYPAIADGGGYPAPQQGEPLELLFFGTGVPLHGLPVLIEAVRQVAGLRLTLCGGSRRERDLAASLPADRLRLLPEFIPAAELEAELQRCHLVAGVFGTSDKAARVLPWKLVMGLAAGRPVLTAQTPAVASALRPGHDCLTVPAGDPSALAEALRCLVADPSPLPAVAQAARLSHSALFSHTAAAERLLGLLQPLVGTTAAPTLKVARAASPQPMLLGREG